MLIVQTEKLHNHDVIGQNDSSKCESGAIPCRSMVSHAATNERTVAHSHVAVRELIKNLPNDMPH